MIGHGATHRYWDPYTAMHNGTMTRSYEGFIDQTIWLARYESQPLTSLRLSLRYCSSVYVPRRSSPTRRRASSTFRSTTFSICTCSDPENLSFSDGAGDACGLSITRDVEACGRRGRVLRVNLPQAILQGLALYGLSYQRERHASSQDMYHENELIAR